MIPNKKIMDEAVSDEHRSLLVDDHHKILQIPVDQIDANPQQPRTNFDHADLEDLINSIKVHGVIQALVVTRKGGRYELIAGERRLRASKILGLPTVPCVLREADEQEKLEIALIENVVRSNLNPLEEALAYQKLVTEFNLTQEEVADKVGKSRSAVANAIRILALPEVVQKALVDRKITEGHARVIAGFDSEDEQLNFLNKILEYNFTVRDAERESRHVGQPRAHHRATVDPSLEAIKEDLRSALSTKVEIHKKAGKGQIIINFYSEEEFHDVVKRITK